MVVLVKQLTTENGTPLTDIKDGMLAIFEAKDGKSYDVKVRISKRSYL